MGKQEKRDKAEKKAKKKAKVIVEQAVEQVQATPTSDEGSLEAQVKELRDAGMQWWVIGQELGLQEEKADSALAGKKGAARARTLYKKASGGSLPPTARAGKGSKPNRLERSFGDGPRPVGRRGRDALLAEEGKSMFTEEHSDDDIVNMLRGKRITVVNSIGGAQEILRVHQEGKVEIAHYPSGRAVQFREDHSDSPGIDKNFKYRQAQMRTVLVERIIRIAA